jgi:hypothetical protein
MPYKLAVVQIVDFVDSHNWYLQRFSMCRILKGIGTKNIICDYVIWEALQ